MCIRDSRYEVDPKYFADKYNMPVGERRQQQVPSPDPDDGGENGKDPRSSTTPVSYTHLAAHHYDTCICLLRHTNETMAEVDFVTLVLRIVLRCAPIHLG